MTGPTIAGILVAGAVVAVAESALIVALLVSRRRQRQSEARNSAMLRALPDIVFLQSREGVYLDYSAKDPSVLFQPPSEFMGKSMRDVLPPPIVAEVEAKLPRLFAGEEPAIIEYAAPYPNGELRHFEARLVRCDDDTFLSIVREFTDQKRADEALAVAQAELARVTKLATLGEFAGSIAHELAQPLTAIIANSHACLRMLERPMLDVAELREGLRDVLVSGNLAREVINHTRHLFSAGTFEKAPVDLVTLVDEVSAMMSSTFRAKFIATELDLDSDLPTVSGDRVQLRQVMLNLISNAIQAMEDADPPRRLTIRISRDDESAVRVTVSDTGVGLAALDRSRLFSVSYTTKNDGMGWGLSISRSIVEAHGGRLWAESNDASGVGASFSFRLPAGGPVEATSNLDRGLLQSQ